MRERLQGQFQPKRDANGQPVTKTVAAEVTRCTRGTLDGHYGCDKNRKLVVRLKAGDVLEMWALGTRQRYTAELKHVYAWLVRGAVARQLLEKARLRKVQKARRRERERERRQLKSFRVETRNAN